MIAITVIVCSHNPRREYISATLEALRAQTLPHNEWELLLVDNSSDPRLESVVDLSWHSAGSHVYEPTLGLTAARLAGIRRARGQLLVFVDDDNVLATDYLATALELEAKYSLLGTWGGALRPQFETPPAAWAEKFLVRLALYEVAEDTWGRMRDTLNAFPAGAGLCVRKCVADDFVRHCETRKEALGFGRIGSGLGGYEDLDLVHVAMDRGLGWGRFCGLSLTHLIPSRRLRLEYFVQHAYENAVSEQKFRYFRGLPLRAAEPEPRGVIRRLRIWNYERRFPKPYEHRQIDNAEQRGLREGYQAVQRVRQHL